MSVSDTQLLVEIREQLKEINEQLRDIEDVLKSDRSMMWKILAMTIIGAFALIGIKIAIP